MGLPVWSEDEATFRAIGMSMRYRKLYLQSRQWIREEEEGTYMNTIQRCRI